MTKNDSYQFTPDMALITNHNDEIEDRARGWITETMNWMKGNQSRRSQVMELISMPMDGAEIFEYICHMRGIAPDSFELGVPQWRDIMDSLSDIMLLGWNTYRAESRRQVGSIYQFTEAMRTITGEAYHADRELLARDAVICALEWLDEHPDIEIAPMNGVTRITDIRWRQMSKTYFDPLEPDDRNAALATVYRIKQEGWDNYAAAQQKPAGRLRLLRDDGLAGERPGP